MSRIANVPLAYFGKLPSRGDFVRSANQASLIQTLDRWLSQGIELMSTDSRWKEVYDRGPKAHFAFLSVNSPRAMAGHLAASTDAAGRRFPFVVAGTFDVGAL
jgi:type VI secretion system protein ImpM